MKSLAVSEREKPLDLKELNAIKKEREEKAARREKWSK